MSAPTSTPIPSEASHVAEARARLARLCAELFSEQDEQGYSALGCDEIRREATDAADQLKLSAALVDRLFQGRPDYDEYLVSRSQMLGHTVRSDCPPYELEYAHAEVFQQSSRLADIAGFYAAFGLESAGAQAERPDHVVPQWEFLSILAAREAQALSREDADGVDCCRHVQRAFLSDHAAFWMFAFFERLRKADSESFFARAGQLAAALLREWCRAHGVPAGSDWIELRPISDEDSTIECGAPDTPNVELGPTLAAAMESSGTPC